MTECFFKVQGIDGTFKNMWKKKFDLPFSFAILSEEKKKSKAVKRSQCFRGSLV